MATTNTQFLFARVSVIYSDVAVSSLFQIYMCILKGKVGDTDSYFQRLPL